MAIGGAGRAAKGIQEAQARAAREAGAPTEASGLEAGQAAAAGGVGASATARPAGGAEASATLRPAGDRFAVSDEALFRAEPSAQGTLRKAAEPDAAAQAQIAQGKSRESAVFGQLLGFAKKKSGDGAQGFSPLGRRSGAAAPARELVEQARVPDGFSPLGRRVDPERVGELLQAASAVPAGAADFKDTVADATAAPALSQAATSALETLRSQLSYGIVDFAVTNANATAAAKALQGLGAKDFDATLGRIAGNEKDAAYIPSRLLTNLAEADATAKASGKKPDDQVQQLALKLATDASAETQKAFLSKLDGPAAAQFLRALSALPTPEDPDVADQVQDLFNRAVQTFGARTEGKQDVSRDFFSGVVNELAKIDGGKALQSFVGKLSTDGSEAAVKTVLKETSGEAWGKLLQAAGSLPESADEVGQPSREKFVETFGENRLAAKSLYEAYAAGVRAEVKTADNIVKYGDKVLKYLDKGVGVGKVLKSLVKLGLRGEAELIKAFAGTGAEAKLLQVRTGGLDTNFLTFLKAQGLDADQAREVGVQVSGVFR